MDNYINSLKFWLLRIHNRWHTNQFCRLNLFMCICRNIIFVLCCTVRGTGGTTKMTICKEESMMFCIDNFMYGSML